MQNVAAYLYRAKQKSGKNHLFIHFEAKSDDHAETKRDFLFMEAGHSKADYFAPVRIDFPVVDELPAEGEFSETFWLTWALESDAGKTCVPRDTLDPSVAFPKLYPYMTKPAGGAGAAENSRTTEKTQVVQEQQKPAGEYFASSLDKHTVAAASWLYGRDCLKLDGDQLSAAKALVMDDAQRYPQNAIMAVTSLRQFDHLYPEVAIVAMAGMKAIWPPFGKVPELGKLCQFATEYLDATVEQRAGVITKWQTSAAGGAKPAETAPEEPLRTVSGAILTNGAEPATGTPIDSLQTLETVIGCALYPSDFDISNPPGAIIRAVTEMKKRNDAALKAWNEQLSATPGVLQFSRQAIVSLVRGAEENLHVTPGALRSYINANLIEVDAKPAQQITEIVQHTASNAGEKDEVVPEFETERRAWLRTEIRAALNGTTTVMGESDVSELIAAIGDVSRGSIARLLAKEIETCDPFNQLVADDVHHITCDVLENWTDDKEQRVAFLDQRVEYNLQEARRASEQKCQEMSAAIDGTVSTPLTQENPEPARADGSNDGKKTEFDQHPGELRSMGGGFFDVSTLFNESPLAKVSTAGATTGDDVREFLDSSTETADVSGETAELSGENVDTAAPVEVQNEAAAAIVDAPRREEPAATITAPTVAGIYYDVPNPVYHSGPGVSKSQLDDIAISPALLLWRQNAPVDTEKLKALDMGSALHCVLLEPAEFDKRFIIAPEFNRRTNAGKAEEAEFLEACANTGKTVMDAEQGRKLNLMRESAMAHLGARWLLESDGHCESSIYWNDQETDELCRIRPDKFLTTHPLIVDVKKVADMSRFSRHIEEFRYHVQAAMYCEGFKAHFGEVPRFAFLAVSETIDCGRYPVRLFLPDDNDLDDGFQSFRRDLTTYHQCRTSNNWGLGFESIKRPYWARSHS